MVKNMVFKTHFTNGVISNASGGMKNNQEISDLLQIKLTVNNIDTIIDLYGNKGVISPKIIFLLQIIFSFGYGSKAVNLPFAIYLHDFQLERYPGSDSPSSLQVKFKLWMVIIYLIIEYL